MVEYYFVLIIVNVGLVECLYDIVLMDIIIDCMLFCDVVVLLCWVEGVDVVGNLYVLLIF